jgi:hypothetical protein
MYSVTNMSEAKLCKFHEAGNRGRPRHISTRGRRIPSHFSRLHLMKWLLTLFTRLLTPRSRHLALMTSPAALDTSQPKRSRSPQDLGEGPSSPPRKKPDLEEGALNTDKVDPQPRDEEWRRRKRKIGAHRKGREYKGVDRRGLPRTMVENDGGQTKSGTNGAQKSGDTRDQGEEGEGKVRLPKKKAAVLIGSVVPASLREG